jgi:hypothetical protein
MITLAVSPSTAWVTAMTSPASSNDRQGPSRRISRGPRPAGRDPAERSDGQQQPVGTGLQVQDLDHIQDVLRLRDTSAGLNR